MALKEINGGYFFRKRTPGPLFKLVKKREIWLSFGKIDLRQAQAIADRIDKFLAGLSVEYKFRFVDDEEAVKRLSGIGIECKSLRDSIGPGKLDFDSLFKKFSQEQTGNGKWTLKTLKEYTSSFALFQRYCSEMGQGDIGHQLLISYRDTLRRLPPNLEKSSEHKGKKIREIIKVFHEKVLSNRQINKYLVCLTSFFKWLEIHEYIGKNPAHNLLLPKNSKVSEERCAYSVMEIDKIINTLIEQRESLSGRPERFWVPIIGIFTGMRLGEICQLHIEDMKNEDGLLCFDVNVEGNRRLKNFASQRLVPVHKRLLELGLIEYIDSVKEKNERLFPLLTLHSVNGYGHQLGKWFTTFNRKYITHDPKKTFHSIRHSVANELKQLQIPGEVISELLGHKVDSITMSRYGKRYRPKVLLEAIVKLPW